jgi:hypothetical protein
MIEISYIDLENNNGSNRIFADVEELNDFLKTNNIMIYHIVEFEIN